MSPWAKKYGQIDNMTKMIIIFYQKFQIFLKSEKYEFNMVKSRLGEGMIKRDQEKIDNTWDCYWYQAIYLNNGKTLFLIRHML